MKKVIGIYSDTAYSGIVIYDVTDEYVENASVVGEKYGRIAKTKIKYAPDGSAYFIKEGRRYYLDEFMRV